MGGKKQGLETLKQCCVETCPHTGSASHGLLCHTPKLSQRDNLPTVETGVGGTNLSLQEAPRKVQIKRESEPVW